MLERHFHFSHILPVYMPKFIKHLLGVLPCLFLDYVLLFNNRLRFILVYFQVLRLTDYNSKCSKDLVNVKNKIKF